MDGEGLALVVGCGSECSISFPWKASFSFGVVGGPEGALVTAFFPWETSFSLDACVGSVMAFMVPMLVG